MNSEAVDEKKIKQKESIIFWLSSITIIILVAIYVIIWIWGNNLVANSCHHFNCVHGWYSKYNDTEKTIAIFSRIISLPVLYFIGLWVTSCFPKTDIVCEACGSKMNKRYARKGVHAGGWFYGCSRYPRCNGVRNILK